MRILYISFNMPWRGGGTFYRVFGFAKHLVERGHEVTILATSPENKLAFTEETWEGVRVVLSPALLGGKLRTGWDLYEVVRRCLWLNGRSFDIIHGFESRPVVIYPALFAHRKSKAPLLLDWCDWFGRGGSVEERGRLTRLLLRPIETFYEEHFRHHAQGTTVINTVLRKRANSLGVSSDSIHWLPNGTDIDNVRVMPQANARRQLEIKPDALLIGHLGQAFPNDARLMAEAFAYVQQQLPKAQLVLIGHHKTDIGVHFSNPTAVIETGFVSQEEMNLYLAACDLLWLPLKNTLANQGRWPMKINDYMSSGRAVVSTDVGDLVDLFQEPHPIGVLSTETPEMFAEKTIALLHDAEQCRRYGENGRFRAEAEFAWAQVTEQLEHFYFRIREAEKTG
ncbi:MAG: glycosyltransferase family 4 protein [Anaerolineales bacterium]|nr:glycosyltransferase family 4 protein [Anaerolineales bacterium]